jgi:hypothetical protein
MNKMALVITSIAEDSHPILKLYARETKERNLQFVVIGDTKSPAHFNLPGCDFYSVERQKSLGFKLSELLPTKHYARKNLGYLVAIKNGADVIVETDDDNIPLPGFWENRSRTQNAHLVDQPGWVNVYKYFTEKNIWPRGFPLENILDSVPKLAALTEINSPIQQGLADDNPDVDAIFRLTQPLPIVFNKSAGVALKGGAVCPFNSQNTTWFKEAFPLLYLPSYCSFRMTDIWRSFVVQRIAKQCEWPVYFHGSSVRQERNAHNIMNDFKDEISGYVSNSEIVKELNDISLKGGGAAISENLVRCYRRIIDLGLIGQEELKIVEAWVDDIEKLNKLNLN